MTTMKRIAWISSALATGATAAALAAILIAGGCGANSPLNADNLGNMIGGSTGQLIKAGGHEANVMALSEKDEDAIGQSTGAVLTNRYGVYQNVQVETYVTLVGLTVASASPNPGGNYVFGVLNTEDINAFSGPNGYIFVTRGALEKMHDEAELAGVLAHEIGHVCHHDGLNQVKAAEQDQAFSEVLSAAGPVSQFSQLTDAGIQAITETGYTQPQEFAADEEGVKIMTAAGYDPHSYLNFLQRLSKLQSMAGGGSIMSTHPAMGERVVRVQSEITQMNDPTGATLEARFDRSMVLAQPIQ
jgi:beta-barrel assembly-enhancing protease